MKPVEIEFLFKNSGGGLDEMSSDLSGVQARVNATKSTIAELHRQMTSLLNRKVTPDMDQSANIKQVEALKSKISELRKEVAFFEKEYPQLGSAAAKTRLLPDDLPKVQSTYNGLHNSIQQIAREMPTLAMGPQMFFMAISNNLPVFTDELARARKEYDSLVKSGQKGVPVWKQVVKSLFSWQTALTTGIMLLVMHGDKVTEWIGSLFKGRNAAKAVTDAVGDLNRALDTESLGGQIADFEKLSRAYRALGDDAEGKRKFIEKYRDEIDKTGIAVNDVADADNLFITNSDAFVASVRQRALALAGMKLASKQYEKALEEKTSKEAELKEYTRLRNYYKQKYDADYAQFGHMNVPVYQNQLKASQVGMQTYQKKIDEINAQIKSFEDAGDAYIDAANRMSSSADKVLEDAGLEDKGQADRDDKEAGKEKEKQNRIAEKKERLARMEAEAQIYVSEAVAEAMAKGYEKEREEAKVEFDRTKADIEKELQERLKLYRELREAGADVPAGAEQRTTALAHTQMIKAAAVYKNRLSQIDSEEAEDNRKQLDSLLKPYKDYAQRRIEIEKKCSDDIRKMQQERTSENAEVIDRAIAEAKRKMQEELQSLDNEISRDAQAGSAIVQRIFSGGVSQTKRQISETITYAEKLLTLLQTGEGDRLGFSDEEIAAMSKDTDLISDLIQKVIDKKEELYGKQGAAGRFLSGFKELKDAFNQKNPSERSEKIEKSLGKMGKSALSINSAFSSVADSFSRIAELTGDGYLESVAFTMQKISGTISSVGQGAMAGGQIGGLYGAIAGAVAGLGMSLFETYAEAEARHSSAMREVQDARLDFQRQYNLLLLEQKLLMEEAEGVFGEKSVQKAANALKVYQEALDKLDRTMNYGVRTGGRGDGGGRVSTTYPDRGGSASSADHDDARASGNRMRNARQAYRDGMKGLANSTIVTGHEKTGLFGWGKGRDVYSNILDVYPKLVDETGKLDAQLLQTILNTQKMDDSTRRYLESLVELDGVMQEAEQAFKDYLGATFGELGDGVLDSVTAALDGSQDRLEGFARNAAGVLENLGEQIAYSLFFADEFAKLQEDLEGIYGSDKSEEQMGNEVMDLLDEFMDGISDNAEKSEEWLRAWQEKAAQKGFDLWKDGSSVSQTGKAGAFTPNMTYDQGTKLEGLFTSVQMHVSSIDDSVDDVAENLGSALTHLKNIETNTKSTADVLRQIRMEMTAWSRDGIKVK